MSALIDQMAQAVRSRDAAAVCKLLFRPIPTVTIGAKVETELWDFKADVPAKGPAWATIARHVLAFHNHRGGVLVFGIRDGDFSYAGASRHLDSKAFNDKIRKFLGDAIWVDFHREAISKDQRYLGIAIVPPRGGNLRTSFPTLRT